MTAEPDPRRRVYRVGDPASRAGESQDGIAVQVAPWRRSSRDRVLEAFAVLNAHGITAVGGCAGDPDTTRTTLIRIIGEGGLAQVGSYVFWTSSDDRCFAGDGSLRRELTLFPSGPVVAGAVLAALSGQGLAAAVRPDGTVSVPPPSVDAAALN